MKNDGYKPRAGGRAIEGGTGERTGNRKSGDGKPRGERFARGEGRPDRPRGDKPEGRGGDRFSRPRNASGGASRGGGAGRGRPQSSERTPMEPPKFDDVKNPIFCALDVKTINDGMRIAGAVRDHVGGLKIGLEYFLASGGYGVKQLWQSKLPIFLDLKFHDIPNTVAGAVRSVCSLRPMMLTVHLAGGVEMVKAAVAASKEEAAKLGFKPPMILGVTVLTSMDEDGAHEVGISGDIRQQVMRLAEVAVKGGAGGIVCSAHEVEDIKKAFGPEIKCVVPGIKALGAGGADQKRVMNPAEALQKGADYLVIGRAITAAPDPKVVARIIETQLKA